MDGFEYQLIDFKGLLLIRYKELGILEEELIILLILLQFEMIPCNNRKVLEERTNFEGDHIDEILIKLIQKRLVVMNGVNIDVGPLKQKLLIKKEEAKDKVDLLTRFEQEFGRPLSPNEMDAIKGWKKMGIEDQLILEALKEASLRNARSMRYIEAIINDWSKNGIKRSGRDQVPAKVNIEYNDYKWWEED